MTDEPETTPEHASEERVRFCLACGQIVGYAQRTCPSCGHVEANDAQPSVSQRVPCRACGEPKGERLLYCPACGAEALPPPAPRATHWSSPPAGQMESLSVVLALITPVLVLIALFQVVLGAIGSRAT